MKRAGSPDRPATVYTTDLWGTREAKYAMLAASDVLTTQWQEIKPVFPYYLFVPQNTASQEEYNLGAEIVTAMPENLLGFQTHRDSVAVAYDRDVLHQQVREYLGREPDPARWETYCQQVDYRVFDTRYAYLHKEVTDRPRLDVVRHMFYDNIGLNLVRQTKAQEWAHVLVSKQPTPAVFLEIKDGSSLFPLYLYPDEQAPSLFDLGSAGVGGRRPNLSPAFITDIEQRLGLHFIPDGRGDLVETIGPEDIFHYIYAVFHSPTYLQRYAEFLKIDFPRVPITSDRALFAFLADKGAELVDLHLLRLPGDDGVGGKGGAASLVSPAKQGVSFPRPGTGVVDKVQYIPPANGQPGRVSINRGQYFEGIEPETWEMHIGGYQPLDKWLKDRKGRTLTFDEIQHYTRVVIALRETRRLMAEIDEIIPGWPLA